MIDVFIVVVFLIANLAIGFYSCKNMNTFSEYAVWKRSFNSFAICATLTASFVGGGYIMGNAAKVYTIGMVYAYALMGFSLKEVLVALFIAPRMGKYSDCYSVGDIMGRHYGKVIQVITGIFSVVICTGILAAQVSAMGALFTLFFNLNELSGILIGFGVIIIYASLGGMRGVVYTDILQFLVLILGIPLICIFGLYCIGGWHAITRVVPPEHINPLLQPNGATLLFTLSLTFLLGEVLVPPYVQRLFMAKTTKETRNATLASGLLSVPIFIVAGVAGLIALVMNNGLDANLAIPYVIEHAMPIGIKGIVIAGLLSVIMSSAAGFLNASAIAFTNDIVPLLCHRDKLTHSVSLNTARVTSLLTGFFAIIFALSVKNILDILIYAYNCWSPVILVPLVAVIFGVSVNAYHFYVSAIAGVLATIIWSCYFYDYHFHMTANVIGVFFSLFAFLIFYFFRQRLIQRALLSRKHKQVAP